MVLKLLELFFNNYRLKHYSLPSEVFCGPVLFVHFGSYFRFVFCFFIYVLVLCSYFLLPVFRWLPSNHSEMHWVSYNYKPRTIYFTAGSCQAIGSRVSGAEYWEQSIGSRVLGAEYWEQSIGSRVSGAEYCQLSNGSEKRIGRKISGVEYREQSIGSRILSTE